MHNLFDSQNLDMCSGISIFGICEGYTFDRKETFYLELYEMPKYQTSLSGPVTCSADGTHILKLNVLRVLRRS